MAITHKVQGSFFDSDSESDDARLIRLAPNAPPSRGPTKRQGRPWTHEEHDRFLQAMEIFPSGPWKDIAAHVGTRNTRQTMTHAQKYRQKIARWKRGASSSSVLKPCPAFSTSRVMVEPIKVTPPSPPAVEAIEEIVNEAEEDAMFWQIIQDILDVSDGGKFEGSMVALLNECQYV